MTTAPFPRWLEWAREIQALSQTGLHYSHDLYETQRYERLLEIVAEMVSDHTGLAKEPLLENFKIQPGYATPKIDVRGAVVRAGKILLVQEKADGRWAMPGGWGDVGEIPSAMVAREVYEESGFQVQPTRVVGVYDANRDGRPLQFYHAYKIIFLCEIIQGAARPSEETLAVDFFDFDKLPPLSSSRTNERHLADVQAHLRNPQQPTLFD
ncbi:MAG: NUDIX hydrolase [candidate division KSB1 bacterium]|nr:NUDIX hydrolase [candidate division KSB1 bacterium]MDZ7318069.1 NUDIX hydrolase [candidate division KSB1 bacterium]MDZ7339762.1 NUDIX hydrolase [candidate division KSB1 bacterium]